MVEVFPERITLFYEIVNELYLLAMDPILDNQRSLTVVRLRLFKLRKNIKYLFQYLRASILITLLLVWLFF